VPRQTVLLYYTVMQRTARTIFSSWWEQPADWQCYGSRCWSVHMPSIQSAGLCWHSRTAQSPW